MMLYQGMVSEILTSPTINRNSGHFAIPYIGIEAMAISPQYANRSRFLPSRNLVIWYRYGYYYY